MKIALCTIGSRGDVQPFLILAMALKARGHEVRFSTARMFEEITAKYDIDFHPFTGEYEKLVNDEEMKKLIGKNPFTIKSQLTKHVYPIIENSLEKFYEVSQWADVVVYHPKTLIDAFGFLFPEKLIKAYVVPAFTPTKAFVNPVLRAFPLPAILNRMSYRLTNALLKTMKTPVRNFHLRHNLKSKFRLLDTPVIYGISESLLPKPIDYPDNHHFTGFWFDKESSKNIPREVEEFFATESKTLIITFGSMPYQSAIPISEFVSYLQKNLEVKVLIVRGWGLQHEKIEEHKNLKVIDKAPFEKLFPLADGVVHHGGAGTTAIALSSGTPMFICPVLHPSGDQYFWGKLIEKQGLGEKPIPLKKLTLEQFVLSVSRLLTRDYSDKSREMQNKLMEEDGVKYAVKIIESHLRH